MKTFLVTYLRKNFSELLDIIHTDPIVLTRYHEPIAVLMSKNHYDRFMLRAAPEAADEDPLVAAYVTHIINNWVRIRDLCREEVQSGQTPDELQDIDAVMRGIRTLERFKLERSIAEGPPNRRKPGPPPGTKPHNAKS